MVGIKLDKNVLDKTINHIEKNTVYSDINMHGITIKNVPGIKDPYTSEKILSGPTVDNIIHLIKTANGKNEIEYRKCLI